MKRTVAPRVILTASLGLASLLAPAVAAQTETPPADPPSQATDPPADGEAAKSEEIGIADVTSQAAALAELLRTIDASLSDPAVIKRVEETLTESENDLATLRSRLDETLERHHLPSELDAIHVTWQGFIADLDSDDGELGTWANQLETWIDEGAVQREQWLETKATAEVESASASVIDTIDEAIRTIDGHAEKLTAARNVATEVQSRLLGQRREAQVIADDIDAAQDALAASLWVPQQPPLWLAFKGSESVRDEAAAVATRVGRLGEQIVEYADTSAARLVVHGLLVFVLGLGLVRARASLRRELGPSNSASGDPPMSMRALAHPWVSALLLGIVMTRYLHPERNIALQLAVGLISLPVVLIVIRPILPVRLRVPLYVLISVAALDLVRLSASEFDVVNRFLMALEMTVCVGGLFWLTRRRRLEVLQPEAVRHPWIRILRAWAWFALLGAVGGWGAVVLGYVNLCDRILMLVLWGTYFLCLWYAGVRIVEALFECIARSGRLDVFRIIRDRRTTCLRWMSRGMRLLALFAWFTTILVGIQAAGPLREFAGVVLSQSVGFGSVQISLGAMLAFVVGLWAAWLLSRFVAFALDQEVLSRVSLAPGVPFALRTFTRYVVLAIGFLIALGMLGVPLTQLTLLISALGVGIGFGLQNIINNFVSGVILLSERRVRVGDVVQVDTLVGTVRDIGIRASTVATFDGSDVIVPNGDLVGARLVNWTLSDQRRRIELPVRVAHGTDATRVLSLLDRIARENDEVLDDPPAQMLFLGFAESNLDFELRAWTDSERGWPAVRSDLAVAVQRMLEEEGIEVPHAQRDLHVRNVDEIKDALTA